MKITKRQLKNIIKKSLKEESKRTPEEISTMRTKSFGETTGNVLKSFSGLSIKDGKRINFAYGGDYKDKEYFYHKGYNSSKLGKYGKVGDPYTYELVDKAQNKYKVVSGPKKNVMGKIFKIKTGGGKDDNMSDDILCPLDFVDGYFADALDNLKDLKKLLVEAKEDYSDEDIPLFLETGLSSDIKDEDNENNDLEEVISSIETFEASMEELLDIVSNNFLKARKVSKSDTDADYDTFAIEGGDNLFCRFKLVESLYASLSVAFLHPVVKKDQINLKDVFNIGGKERSSLYLQGLGGSGANVLTLLNFYKSVHARLKSGEKGNHETFWSINSEAEAEKLGKIQDIIGNLI